MAQGALQRAPVELAVAVTGIAGPGGAVPGKPVGTVWLAWGTAERRARPNGCSWTATAMPCACATRARGAAAR